MKESIETFRKEIDEIDNTIAKFLFKRMSISKKIGCYKKENGFCVRDPSRENQIINKLSDSSGLNYDFIKKVYDVIFEESRRIQNNL
jgi:monofunctional chorismate mutase